MAEEFIPIVMFAGLTIVFVALFWFRYRARRDMQETFRTALDRGTGADAGNHRPPRPSRRPARTRICGLGVIWLALAVGLVLCGLAVPDPSGDALRGILAGAAFPFSIGIAYLILYRFTERGLISGQPKLRSGADHQLVARVVVRAGYCGFRRAGAAPPVAGA